MAAVNVAGGPVANAGNSSESSMAYAGRAPQQNAASSVIGLGGTGLPVPAAGCDNGTPNTTVSVAGLLTAICNAENTVQAVAPSGVREALSVIVLPALGSALVKTVVAASKSHAVAPAVSSAGGGGASGGNGGTANRTGGSVGGHTTHPCPAANDTGRCEDTNPNGGTLAEGAAAKNELQRELNTATGGELPFTGEDVLKVLLAGLMVAGAGVALNLKARADS